MRFHYFIEVFLVMQILILLYIESTLHLNQHTVIHCERKKLKITQIRVVLGFL